jgi:hypothetical protein
LVLIFSSSIALRFKDLSVELLQTAAPDIILIRFSSNRLTLLYSFDMPPKDGVIKAQSCCLLDAMPFGPHPAAEV